MTSVNASLSEFHLNIECTQSCIDANDHYHTRYCTIFSKGLRKGFTIRLELYASAVKFSNLTLVHKLLAMIYMQY